MLGTRWVAQNAGSTLGSLIRAYKIAFGHDPIIGGSGYQIVQITGRHPLASKHTNLQLTGSKVQQYDGRRIIEAIKNVVKA